MTLNQLLGKRFKALVDIAEIYYDLPINTKFTQREVVMLRILRKEGLLVADAECLRKPLNLPEMRR